MWPQIILQYMPHTHAHFFFVPPQTFRRKSALSQASQPKSAHPFAYPEKDITGCFPKKTQLCSHWKKVTASECNKLYTALSPSLFAPPKVHTKKAQVQCLRHRKNTTFRFVPEASQTIVLHCCQGAATLPDFTEV
jgi:hypothetical protein